MATKRKTAAPKKSVVKKVTKKSASKKKTNYSKKTYQVYGEIPQGNHTLQLAMGNDRKLYDYVSRNNKVLAKLPKDDCIKLIKSHASEDWARKDLRSVNSSNVKATDLKAYLKDFNN